MTAAENQCQRESGRTRVDFNRRATSEVEQAKVVNEPSAVDDVALHAQPCVGDVPCLRHHLAEFQRVAADFIAAARRENLGVLTASEVKEREDALKACDQIP